MTLGAVVFKNFTVFEDATFELCPGFNVLIGANATGKTHAMKAMYAILRAIEGGGIGAAPSKLMGVFRPDPPGTGRLIRRDGGEDRWAEVTFSRARKQELSLDIAPGRGIGWSSTRLNLS